MPAKTTNKNKGPVGSNKNSVSRTQSMLPVKIHSNVKNFVEYVNIGFPYFFVISTYQQAVSSGEIRNYKSLFFLFCSMLYLISYTIIVISKIFARKKIA